MKFNKPKFWDKKYSFFSIILLPVSLVVLLLISLKKKFTKSIKFDVPIICFGNIYIGGTGKTPSAIFLANELFKLGKNPVILRKYYESHVDEYNLIKKKFNNLILDRNRADGLKKAKIGGFDSVILDDGFQDYKIKKDLNIVCFNHNQLVGNGLILPAGPLRESLGSLINANLVLINGSKDNDFEQKILSINKNLQIFYSHYKPTNIDQFINKKLLAISGIGNPENFFKLAKEHGLRIEKKIIFPDHYEFNEKEIKNIVKEAKDKNYQIIMTEKDFFKINHFDIDNDEIKYIKLSLEIKEREKFIKAVTKIYDKKN